MLPDNKAQRRKIIKGEDVRQYEYRQRHKYDMDKRLDNLGYPKGYVMGDVSDITCLGW
jgi:hypothetical protein